MPTYSGVPRYNGDLWPDTSPGPLIQAAAYGAKQLYEVAAANPELTWREVGAKCGPTLPSPGPLPKRPSHHTFYLSILDPEARAEAETYHKRLYAWREFYALPAAVRRGGKMYCEREGKPFPFRKR